MSCIVENGRSLCPSALRFAGNDLPCPCCDTPPPVPPGPIEASTGSHLASCFVSVFSVNDHHLLQVPTDADTCSVTMHEDVPIGVWPVHTASASCDGDVEQHSVGVRSGSSCVGDRHLTRITEPPDDNHNVFHFPRADWQSEDLDLLELLTDPKLAEPLDDRDSDLDDVITSGCQTPGLCDVEDDGDLGSDEYEQQEDEMEQETEFKNGFHEDPGSTERGDNRDVSSTSPISQLLHRKRNMFYVGDEDEIINFQDGIYFENCSSSEDAELSLDSVSQQNNNYTLTACYYNMEPPKPILRRASPASLGFPMKSAFAPFLVPVQPILASLPLVVVSEVERLRRLYPGISENYLQILCEFGLLEEVTPSGSSSPTSTLSRSRGISLTGSFLRRKMSQSNSDTVEDQIYERSVFDDGTCQPEYRATQSVRGLFMTASLVSMAAHASSIRERKKSNNRFSSRYSQVKIGL